MLGDLAKFLVSGISLLFHSPPPNCMCSFTFKFSTFSCLCDTESNSQLPSKNYQHPWCRAKNPFKIIMRVRKVEGKILSFHIFLCISSRLLYLPTLKATPNHLLDTLGQVYELKSNALNMSQIHQDEKV